MAGRPRIPAHLKVIAGTLRPGREQVAPPLFAALDQVPPAPDWLPNAHAKKEWERLAPILTANGLLSASMLGPLGMLCALHGKLAQAWTAGAVPKPALISMFRLLSSDFGIPPAARGKVRPGSDGSRGNRFSNNGRRP